GRDKPVVFVHTGGASGLFARTPVVSAALADRAMPHCLAYFLMAALEKTILLLTLDLLALYVFCLSFHHSVFGTASEFVGFTNYAFVLTDPYFWRAFLNTFVVVNVVVYVELALALGMATLFATGAPLRRFMISIVIAPYAVSEVVAVVIWKYM